MYDGYLLTADGNIMHARATLRYRITDAVRYALNFTGASNVVRNALNNALNFAAARHLVDDAVRKDVAGFRDEVRRRLDQTLIAQDLGVVIENLELIPIPPRQVEDAFDAVLGAEAVSGTPGDMQLVLHDALSGARHTLRSRHVINATGAWADRLSGADARVRPLRGSHLFVPAARLPVSDCLTVMHPDDGRPVFVFPWEGLTCIGTTDLDHGEDLDMEPRVSQREVDYLLRLVNTQFPDIRLTEGDIVSTMAGVRPVISSGKGLDPSKERRDHAVWTRDGVITVSGGKLTTFRVIALDALLAATLIDRQTYRRLLNTPRLFRQAPALPAGLGHPTRAWPQGEALGESLRWVLSHEMVQHLDDLMLRRTRLGNLLPNGGAATLAALRPLICTQLGWDDARWDSELARYLDIVQRFYSLPDAA